LKSKLHILFLCGWYPSRVLPSNGDFIERHAHAISLSHRVTVIHIISDENSTHNLEIISTKKEQITTHIAYLKKTNNPIKKYFLFIKAFLKILQKVKNFDIVHLNEVYPFGIFSLYLKWFKNKQYIISEHFTGYHLPQAKKLAFNRLFISKIITKNATFVCPVSNNLRDAMLALNLNANYFRVPNVVNTNLFFPSEKNNAAFTITHISNMLNQHKNVEGFLRVVKKLESKIADFKVQLIGENAFRYKEFAKKINLDSTKIEFIDQIPHTEIVTHLQNSSLFVLFSNYENLPCVILESFACGTPVIASNVGGISEFFPKEFGFLVPPKDENALLDKILTVRKGFKVNKKEMHKYVVENFSENKIASDFEKLYFKSLKPKF
jgi:glycosyltransferase involved in cell wall biosynthesis